MIEVLANPRIVEPKDWASVLFLFSLLLIAIAKSSFETRFQEFLRILVSDKYIKVYRDSNNLLSGFTILLFFVQVISFSFFIQVLLNHYGIHTKYDWISFLRVATFFSVFILSKFLIEKIVATIFDFEEIIDEFNLQKVSYRSFISLLIFPISIFLFFSNNSNDLLIFLTIFLILIINLITYFFSLKNYQNFILSNIFYFILYLCALEIAPYYFIYYLITKQ